MNCQGYTSGGGGVKNFFEKGIFGGTCSPTKNNETGDD